jgi:hypothetical protein
MRSPEDALNRFIVAHATCSGGVSFNEPLLIEVAVA